MWWWKIFFVLFDILKFFIMYVDLGRRNFWWTAINSEPSFFAGVTFQKEPVINEIREVETFIFKREKKKNDYEKNI